VLVTRDGSRICARNTRMSDRTYEARDAGIGTCFVFRVSCFVFRVSVYIIYVRVRVYIYIYIYIYICAFHPLCVRVIIHARYTCVRVRVRVCMLCVCVCVCVHARARVLTGCGTHVCIYARECMYVCMYVYTCAWVRRCRVRVYGSISRTKFAAPMPRVGRTTDGPALGLTSRRPSPPSSRRDALVGARDIPCARLRSHRVRLRDCRLPLHGRHPPSLSRSRPTPGVRCRRATSFAMRPSPCAATPPPRRDPPLCTRSTSRSPRVLLHTGCTLHACTFRAIVPRAFPRKVEPVFRRYFHERPRASTRARFGQLVYL